MSNVSVQFMNMPTTIKACVVRCFDTDDIFFTIMVNARMSDSQQQEAYRHEISHIEHGDFSRCVSVDYIESMRH